MSQRVHRILVLVALVACDAPAAQPDAPAVAPVEPPAPTPPAVTAAPEPELPEPPAPSTLAPELERAVVAGMNDLTIRLQRVLAKQPGNLFASGMSVSVALAMLHAGSEGKTERELAKLLAITGPDAHAGFASLAARWTYPDPDVTMVMASRLFGEEKMAFKPAYLDLTRDVFHAPLETLDFQNEPDAARAQINGWVRQQTRDKIVDLLPAPAVTSATRLVLANAVYFKADWLEPFDPAATREQPFFGAAGKRMVPTMHATQRLRVAYGKAGKLRVLEVPYKGGRYSMVIVLPGTRGGLPALEKSFDAAKLQSWIDAGKETSIDLQLPRFNLDSGFELTPALQRLGLTTVFNPKRAELGGMATEKLALSSVAHRAQVTVEERGTEAAAATAIVIAVGSLPASPTPFIVDRPFLFYIRDVRSGALLFFGRVTDL